ncbi:hypothetical protein F5Y15DRAFT_226303 [Xylariaceae sp. FL0016]|nr:hypothetical protein F5Y15DRAFT_226303 [Xylariaceae sp. FL0016]
MQNHQRDTIMTPTAPLNLLTIPLELRQEIYRHVFTRSEIRMKRLRTIFAGPFEIPAPAYGPSNWHVYGDTNILLTCKQAYQEGRAVFWQETRLYGERYWDSWSTVEELSSALGDFAKEHVRHIRDLDLQCTFVNSSIQDILATFAPFKSLRTCYLAVGAIRDHPEPHTGLRCPYCVSENLEHDDALFNNLDSPGAAAFREITASDTPITFVTSYRMIHSVYPYIRKQVYYVNLNTKKCFFDYCDGSEPEHRNLMSTEDAIMQVCNHSTG